MQHSAVFGEWGELDLPPDRPGLASSLIGKVVGRVLARKFGEGQMRELMREVLTASPTLRPCR